MSGASTLALIVGLSDTAHRANAASSLASHLGSDELLLLVQDPEVGAFIPAPGMPQTLHGGPAWRRFLAECAAGAEHGGQVDLPSGRTRPARAFRHDRVVAVLVGGSPHEPDVQFLRELLPIIGAMLRCEQQATLALHEAAAARDMVGRAHALANALEAARADSAKLNAELQEEERRKDEFLAMLGHELRNPLTPLLGTIELLRRSEGVASSLESHLDIMARQATQLTRLVDDLLDVARVSRGRVELKNQCVLVRDVLEDAIQDCRTLLDAAGHSVSFEVEGELAVNGDPARLRQVFGNLVNNAGKYTPHGGRISVRARAAHDEAVITIEDSGIGIDPGILPHVFDLFIQAPQALDRSQGGLGIGLKLVHHLVELHGGRVEAASRGPGHGSTFTVHLPRIEVPVVPRKQEAAQPVLVTSPLHVVVVDDNRDAAQTLAEMLRILGHEVRVGHDGGEGLQIASAFKPQLLILDIGLPGMDGFSLARELRARLGPDPYMVALTGYGAEDVRRRASEVGFDAHVVKPLELQQLENLLTSAVTRRSSAKAPVRVLVIDDNEDVRKFMRMALESAGFIVETASDGEGGLKHMKASPANVVVTDISMPNMDGMETIQRLRHDHPTAGIVAVSGAGTADSKVDYLWLARQIGAGSSLRKPFTVDALVQAVRQSAITGTPS